MYNKCILDFTAYDTENWVWNKHTLINSKSIKKKRLALNLKSIKTQVNIIKIASIEYVAVLNNWAIRWQDDDPLKEDAV